MIRRRRAAMPKRVDANQAEIVEALRAVGCSVAITSDLGKGFVDIVVGRAGANFLMEIKDGRKSKSKRKLTPAEREFHQAWRGQVCVVKSVDDALRIVGVI